MDGRRRDHHSGELKRESDEAKAGRIIAEELQRLGWTETDLHLRLKLDPNKSEIAIRQRKEIILSIKWIATHLRLGAWEKRQDAT